MRERKTHHPDTRRDSGPVEPSTFCGRALSDVDLALFETKPTCKLCARQTESRHAR